MKAKNFLSISCDEDQFSSYQPFSNQIHSQVKYESEFSSESQKEIGKMGAKRVLSRANNDPMYLSKSVDVKKRNEQYPNLKELLIGEQNEKQKVQEYEQIKSKDINIVERNVLASSVENFKAPKVIFSLSQAKQMVSIVMPPPKTTYFQSTKQRVSSTKNELNFPCKRQQIQSCTKTASKLKEFLQNFDLETIALPKQKNNHIISLSESKRISEEKRKEIHSSIDFNNGEYKNYQFVESPIPFQISIDTTKLDKLKEFIPKSSSSSFSSKRKYVQKCSRSEQKVDSSYKKKESLLQKTSFSTNSLLIGSDQQEDQNNFFATQCISISQFNESINLADNSSSFQSQVRKKDIYLTKQEKLAASSMVCLTAPSIRSEINFSTFENNNENDSNLQSQSPLPNSRILKIYSELQKSQLIFDLQSPIMMNSDITETDNSKNTTKLQQLKKEKREAELDLVIINSSLIQHMQHTSDLFSLSMPSRLQNKLEELLNSLAKKMSTTLERKNIFY